MTLKESIKTLEQRKKGLAYRLWKEGNLFGIAMADLWKDKGKKSLYPENPEKASPELYPPPATIKMPDFLKNKEPNSSF